MGPLGTAQDSSGELNIVNMYHQLRIIIIQNTGKVLNKKKS